MLLASWLSRRIVAFGSNPHRLPSLLRRGASAWFWALVAVCLLAGAAQARAQHTLIVNTLADSLNGSTNCVNGTLICSLRDAITQADLDSGDIIDFSPSVTGVITLSALGSLPQITAPVTINGPTGGAPSEVTVDGANTYQVLTVGSSVAVTISNLAIRNGYDTTGGGIDNYGNLILIGDTLYDNVAASATGVGGGVYSEGATAQLTVIDGTFYGNTADVGGAIYSLLGKLTVEESTIYGNSASTGTGGIVNFGGTVSVANSIVDFNTVVTTVGTKSYQDINNLSGGTCNNSSDGTCNTSSAYGNVLGILGPSASKEPVALPISTLGFWGGTTETLLPLPSSSAICGGLSASKFLTATGSTLASTDQRGSSRTTTYTPANSSVTSSTTCVDAGAVQTNFSIAWSVQPPATVGQSETMTPAPAVQLDESGVPWIDPGESTIGVGMSLTGVGSLTNSAAQVTPATGVATFGNLSVNEVGGPDYLTAILKLTASGTTPAVKLYTPRSDPFQVVPSVTQLVFATPPATPVVLNGNAGTVVINEEDSNGNVVTGALDAVALTVTGPSGSGYSASYTATAVNGVATINLSAVPLTFVGTYTYTATDVSYPTVTSAVATEKVGEAASGLVGPSTTQTFAYGEGGSIPITVTGQTGIASPGGNISYTIGSGTSQTAAITAITPPSTPPSGGAAITVPASLAAGTYTVTVNYGGDSKYNGATAVSFTLIVAQASSTIGHLPNATFAYGTGGTIPVTVTGQYSGAGIATPSGNITYNLGNGVIYTAAITSGDATLTVPATLPPGTYTATVSYAGDSNYDAATAVSFNLTIGSATLTISANNATKPYGAPNPTFTGSVTGAAASDTFSETFTTGATASSPVGTYPITPSVTGANLADYTVVANNGTLTVAQASSTIGHLSNASLAYGAGGTIPVTVAGQYSGAGIATPGGNITYNLGNGVIYTAAITSGGATLTVPATLPQGTYTATVSYAGDSSYSPATAVSFTLTIGSATLTVSANNATKVYGAPNPTFTGSVTGASGSDTFSETYTTGATTSSTVGTYPITPAVTGANVADYTVVVDNGTLTVTPASSTIGHLSNTSFAYGAGGTIQVTVAGQYSGAGIATPGGNITYNLGNGVIYTAAITSGGATLTVPATMAAGVYTATVSYAGDSNYVAASAVNFTLTVGSATLTVSANNATKAYGAPNPTFTGSVTGAAASDTFSETYTTGATPSSPVGTYSITPSVTGANLADYTVVTNNGTLTVTQASTTLAILGAALSGPASASFSFGSGGSIPIVVAGQYSGAGIASPSGNIAYSIGSGAVQTAAIVSSGAALLVPASQPAGTYTVAITYAGDTNYSGASISLTLTVTSATLTISANNATKVYGEANPTLSGNETGASFPETFTTAAVTLSPVGAYAIVPAVTGANVADYAQTVVNGTLTVTQATTTTALSTGGTVYSGQSVPLTAVVSPEYSGTPTGTVSFYDGTTLLGTATVNGGTANLSTTLASGVAQTLSATYNGDTNFTPSTSSPLSVAIAPLDFTIAVSGASIDTVLPGASASYTLTVTPTLGTYPGPVTFSVSGLPATDTVTFTPSTIAANGGTQTVTMTVQTAAATARENQSPGGPFGRLPIALGLLLLPFAGARRLRRQGRKFGRFLCLLLVLAGSIAAASMLTACSNSNGFFLTAPSSSPLSVTGLSGGVQHSVNVTLNVE